VDTVSREKGTSSAKSILAQAKESGALSSPSATPSKRPLKPVEENGGAGASKRQKIVSTILSASPEEDLLSEQVNIRFDWILYRGRLSLANHISTYFLQRLVKVGHLVGKLSQWVAAVKNGAAGSREVQEENSRLKRELEAKEKELEACKGQLESQSLLMADQEARFSKYGSLEAHLELVREAAWKTLRSKGLSLLVNRINRTAGEMYLDAEALPVIEALLPENFERKAEVLEEFSFPGAGALLKHSWQKAIQPGGIELEFLDHLALGKEPLTGSKVRSLTVGDIKEWDVIPPAPESSKVALPLPGMEAQSSSQEGLSNQTGSLEPAEPSIPVAGASLEASMDV
jgi:hypothetical protein